MVFYVHWTQLVQQAVVLPGSWIQDLRLRNISGFSSFVYKFFSPFLFPQSCLCRVYMRPSVNHYLLFYCGGHAVVQPVACCSSSGVYCLLRSPSCCAVSVWKVLVIPSWCPAPAFLFVDDFCNKGSWKSNPAPSVLHWCPFSACHAAVPQHKQASIYVVGPKSKPHNPSPTYEVKQSCHVATQDLTFFQMALNLEFPWVSGSLPD